MIRYTIVSGSHRHQSQSEKVANFIEGRLRAKGAADVHLLTLAGNSFPLWDETLSSADPKWENWRKASAQLKASEAIIIVSPEWSGMVPAGLKNIFLLCSSGELAHKPGLIVTVSASQGGAYPVAELRMSSYKNTFFSYIPDHIIIRDAANVLGVGEPTSENDVYLRKRLDYTLDVLGQYASALRQVRQSGVINLKDYPYGM